MIDIELFFSELSEITERPVENIQRVDSFKEYEEWSSIATLSLVVLLDENYNIQISREEYDNLLTIEDLINFINSK